MKNRFMLTMALTAGLTFAALSPLRADEGTSARTDPGFRPDTGQINDARPQQTPAASGALRKIPTPEETLAAKMTPVSTQPSTGEQAQAGPAQPPVTTGAASNDGAAGAGNEPPPSGPIGAVGQTIPAKFSKRNDVLDRTPIMAWPLALDAEQRKQIFDAVMADKSPAVEGADALAPASQLSTDQALNRMRALPDSVQGIDAVKRLKYLKTKDKILLVEPSTRIVVDQISS